MTHFGPFGRRAMLTLLFIFMAMKFYYQYEMRENETREGHHCSSQHTTYCLKGLSLACY